MHCRYELGRKHNIYSKSKPTIPDTLNFYNNKFNQTPTSFNFSENNEELVMKAGCDGFTIDIIKICCSHILSHLVHIVNYCLTEGCN